MRIQFESFLAGAGFLALMIGIYMVIIGGYSGMPFFGQQTQTVYVPDVVATVQNLVDQNQSKTEQIASLNNTIQQQQEQIKNLETNPWYIEYTRAQADLQSLRNNQGLYFSVFMAITVIWVYVIWIYARFHYKKEFKQIDGLEKERKELRGVIKSINILWTEKDSGLNQEQIQIVSKIKEGK